MTLKKKVMGIVWLNVCTCIGRLRRRNGCSSSAPGCEHEADRWCCGVAYREAESRNSGGREREREICTQVRTCPHLSRDGREQKGLGSVDETIAEKYKKLVKGKSIG